MTAVLIPGIRESVPGVWREIDFGPPPTAPRERSDAIDLGMREWLDSRLKSGEWFLNGPDHPVPSFPFYCVAPDVVGFPRVRSLLLNGKRIGRIYFNDDGAIEREAYHLDAPEEIGPGEVVLMPQPEERE